MQMQNFEKHVWAEIDLDALRANFRTVKQRAGSLPRVPWSRPTATATVPCSAPAFLRKRVPPGWP